MSGRARPQFQGLVSKESSFQGLALQGFVFKDSDSVDGRPNDSLDARGPHFFAGTRRPLEKEACMATKPPRRVAARSDPAQWRADELLTFAEAAALLWPDGPLTASTLRTAYRAGGLEVTVIARELLTTKRALAALAARAAP